jgi:DNA-binding NtrC family response regulator
MQVRNHFTINCRLAFNNIHAGGAHHDSDPMMCGEMMTTAQENALDSNGRRAETMLSCANHVTPGEPARLFLPTGTSPAISEVTGLLRQVAAFDSTVLILGESGTGKEVAARAIHELSPRRQRPFAAINCGAIPTDLLESELSATKRAPSPARSRHARGALKLPRAARCFSMKSAI